MREILFKGKTCDGKWEQGDLRHGGYVHNDSETYIMRADVALHNIPVDPKTIGQYIEKTDKNGTKIFEGDICKNTENGKTAVVKWYEEYNADMLYCKSENHVYWLFDVDFAKIEVIGNIHDNPELMGGNENE